MISTASYIVDIKPWLVVIDFEGHNLTVAVLKFSNKYR